MLNTCRGSDHIEWPRRDPGEAGQQDHNTPCLSKIKGSTSAKVVLFEE
jgi:hypothetical protein